MRLLLIEDTTQLAGPIARELHSEYGHRVTCVRDPLEARELDEQFDLAVVDLLYEHLSRPFDQLRLARQVSLTRDRLLITGLTAVKDLSKRSPSTKIVLWSSGEANRRLHLQYAYEDLRIRAYCSKSSGTGRADVLNTAITAAANGQDYVDSVLSPYLPYRRKQTISSTLFRESARRAIWAAVALGAHTRSEISDVTGYSTRTIGGHIPGMVDDLVVLDQGITPGARPINEIVRYASQNWEFFLDDALKLQ